MRNGARSRVGCAAAWCAAGATATAGAHDSGLTATETRWLQLGWPVVTYAREQGLPLDIVVQPQSAPDHAPLAMAWVDGRCKLVLSMRDNPAAESTLDQIPPDLLGPAVEAMAAHELGHCWRYLRGAWHTVPAGFMAASPASRVDDTSVQHQLLHMQQTRREEGYADLVGLAWTWQRHPQHYARLHAWLVDFRDEPALPGSHHDTLAWLRLATRPEVFDTAATPFEQAWPLWQRGLTFVP